MSESYIELQRMRAEAERLAQEAAADKKAAAEDRAQAEYDRGQSAWNLRETQALEKNIAAREKKLEELGEATLLAREQAASDQLKQAQELMQAYDRDKHAAAISLNQINEREKAREAAARGRAA